MKQIKKVLLLIAAVVLLTGCGNNGIKVKGESAQSIIKLGEEYSTVEVIKWEIQEERIRILTTNGEIFNLLYKDVVLITKGF